MLYVVAAQLPAGGFAPFVRALGASRARVGGLRGFLSAARVDALVLHGVDCGRAELEALGREWAQSGALQGWGVFFALGADGVGGVATLVREGLTQAADPAPFARAELCRSGARGGCCLLTVHDRWALISACDNVLGHADAAHGARAAPTPAEPTAARAAALAPLLARLVVAQRAQHRRVLVALPAALLDSTRALLTQIAGAEPLVDSHGLFDHCAARSDGDQAAHLPPVRSPQTIPRFSRRWPASARRRRRALSRARARAPASATRGRWRRARASRITSLTRHARHRSHRHSHRHSRHRAHTRMARAQLRAFSSRG